MKSVSNDFKFITWNKNESFDLSMIKAQAPMILVGVHLSSDKFGNFLSTLGELGLSFCIAFGSGEAK